MWASNEACSQVTADTLNINSVSDSSVKTKVDTIQPPTFKMLESFDTVSVIPYEGSLIKQKFIKENPGFSDALRQTKLFPVTVAGNNDSLEQHEMLRLPIKYTEFQDLIDNADTQKDKDDALRPLYTSIFESLYGLQKYLPKEFTDQISFRNKSEAMMEFVKKISLVYTPEAMEMFSDDYLKFCYALYSEDGEDKRLYLTIYGMSANGAYGSSSLNGRKLFRIKIGDFYKE